MIAALFFAQPATAPVKLGTRVIGEVGLENVESPTVAKVCCRGAHSSLLAPFFVVGNAGLYAIMLRQVPEEMRGRVTSTVTMTAMALATLAPLLAGLLVEHVSTSWAIGAFAAAQAVAAVLTLVMPGLKNLDARPTAARAG